MIAVVCTDTVKCDGRPLYQLIREYGGALRVGEGPEIPNMQGRHKPIAPDARGAYELTCPGCRRSARLNLGTLGRLLDRLPVELSAVEMRFLNTMLSRGNLRA